jgi:hypothetical protein
MALPVNELLFAIIITQLSIRFPVLLAKGEACYVYKRYIFGSEIILMTVRSCKIDNYNMPD